MKSLYSQSKLSLPDDFIKPTQSFKKHIWFAIAGLFLFVGTYTVLCTWFGYLGVKLFADLSAGNGNPVFNVLMGFGFLFLCVFMLKSLFFIGKKEKEDNEPYELTQEKEPILFDYLYQLADEIGAPRPHKVVVTADVNAAVYYDLSILNLLFPSKKNLIIGLGLVNVLSLGEFKAVLAHEFGHFAQRSMLLGRYVYVAHQIAAQLIGKRDALDSFLAGLSSIDIRIAWIGWILSILVWSIRSLIEILFSIVQLSERALSREMEYQADLVAVSVTGSDALIHGLHKLRAADQAFNGALVTLNELINQKKEVADLYSLQTNFIERMRWVSNDPTFGKSIEIPENNADSHRVFSNGAVNPPQMWSTHPLDNLREENAKKKYIKAEIDERSSWDLFTDPKQLRKDLTKMGYKGVEVECTKIEDEESIAYQNKHNFDYVFLDPKYEGNYYKRNVFSNFRSADDLYSIEFEKENLKEELNKIYPCWIGDTIDEYNSIQVDKQMLTFAKNERMTAEKREIHFQGAPIKRKDIPSIIHSLEEKEAKLRVQLMEHDKHCRSLHFAMAEELRPGLGESLKGIVHLMHYCEHTVRNLSDARLKLDNVVSIALADGKVSNSELKKVLTAANDLHHVLWEVFDNSSTIQLNDELHKKLEVESYKAMFEKFEFPPAKTENINEWMNCIDSWLGIAMKNLYAVKNAALEFLLEKEDEIRASYVEKESEKHSIPNQLKLLESYKVLLPGEERELQYKLNLWDSFYANDGIVATFAKLIVTLLIVGGALSAGVYGSYSSYELYMYNGLETEVDVTVNNKVSTLKPHGFTRITDLSEEVLSIKAETSDGLIIESFKQPIDTKKKYQIYNVAGASTLTQYGVAYGNASFNPPKNYGAQRWITTKADYRFITPPSQVRTKGSGTVKYVLDANDETVPFQQVKMTNSEHEEESLIRNHIKFDDPDSKFYRNWLYLGHGKPYLETELKQKMTMHPGNIILARFVYNTMPDSLKEEFCFKVNKAMMADIENPNKRYIAARCIADEEEKNKAFKAGHKKWPEHSWFSLAAGYVYSEEKKWVKAYNALTNAGKSSVGLNAMIGADRERLRRMAEYKGTVLGNSHMEKWNSENYYTELEQGKHKGRWDHIFYYLAQRDVKKIRFTLGRFPEETEVAKGAIANSDLGMTDIEDEVLAPDYLEKINNFNYWNTLALYIRKKRPTQLIVNKLEDINPIKKKLPDYIDLIQRKQFNQLEIATKNLHFVYQVQLKMVALIVHPKECPKEWRIEVEHLLFIDEKPSFR